jgi:purine-binding chemotaxis protein CheW
VSGQPPVRRDTIVPGAPQRDRTARLRAGTQGVSEFLGFRVAHEAYALPLASVREILKLGPITEVPRAAKDVLGIVSVRGRVTTVLDLRKRLRMSEREPTKHARVLLVDGGDEVIGLLVDEVLQVYRLRGEEIEVADAQQGERSDYVIGIGRPGAQRAQARKPSTGRTRKGAHGLVRVVETPTESASHATASAALQTEMLILLDPASLLRR